MGCGYSSYLMTTGNLAYQRVRKLKSIITGSTQTSTKRKRRHRFGQVGRFNSPTSGDQGGTAGSLLSEAEARARGSWKTGLFR